MGDSWKSVMSKGLRTRAPVTEQKGKRGLRACVCVQSCAEQALLCQVCKWSRYILFADSSSRSELLFPHSRHDSFFPACPRLMKEGKQGLSRRQWVPRPCDFRLGTSTSRSAFLRVSCVPTPACRKSNRVTGGGLPAPGLPDMLATSLRRGSGRPGPLLSVPQTRCSYCLPGAVG